MHFIHVGNQLSVRGTRKGTPRLFTPVRQFMRLHMPGENGLLLAAIGAAGVRAFEGVVARVNPHVCRKV